MKQVWLNQKILATPVFLSYIVEDGSHQAKCYFPRQNLPPIPLVRVNKFLAGRNKTDCSTTTTRYRDVKVNTHLPAGRISSKVTESGRKPSVNVVKSKLLVGRLQNCLQMCSEFYYHLLSLYKTLKEELLVFCRKKSDISLHFWTFLIIEWKFSSANWRCWRP